MTICCSKGLGPCAEAVGSRVQRFERLASAGPRLMNCARCRSIENSPGRTSNAASCACSYRVALL
eukprot:765228-Hanusia_phi.AAC.3